MQKILSNYKTISSKPAILELVISSLNRSEAFGTKKTLDDHTARPVKETEV